MSSDAINNNAEVDVVLLQLPFWGVGCPPLALGLLQAYLKEQGISCRIIDINAQAYAIKGKKYYEYWHVKNGYNFCMEYEPMLHFYKDHRALFLHNMEEIKKLNPTFVGCSVQNTSRILTEIFLEDLKANYPGFNHILGGPEVAHFMENTDQLLSHNFVDAVCQDEGEKSLVEYIRMIKAGKGDPVSGMVYKNENEIVRCPPAEYIAKLDELPFPDFDGINLKHYGANALPTYSTRGCVNKCNYCSAIGFMTNKRYPFRLRSAPRIFDELIYLKSKYPELDEVRMCDNISNAKMKSLEEFCDLMIESGMNKQIKWSLENAVIRKEMRRSIYDKLKEAGCTLLGYGMETPSVRLLHDVGKTLAVNKEVDLPAILREGKEAGLVVSVNVMFGLPTETEDDFNFLMEFLRDNKNAFSMINPSLNFCEYYPGSKGHQNPEEHNIDLTKGTLFWDSADGNNTYLTRMRRFEKFCHLAKDFNIDNLFQIQELPNKHKLLFEYYYLSNDADNAAIEYDQIAEDEQTEEIKAKYIAITTGDKTALGSLEAEQGLDIKDYLLYEGSPERNLLAEPLSEYIDDFVKIKSYDMEYPESWKTALRWFVLQASASGYFDHLVKKVMEALADIDKEIINSLNQPQRANSFGSNISKIEKYAGIASRKHTGMLAYLSQMNATAPFYAKLHNMLVLFIDALKLVNTSSSESADVKMNSLITELNNFHVTEDEAVANPILNNVLKNYKRVVGYKEFDKKTIAVHIQLCILAKKMKIMLAQQS